VAGGEFARDLLERGRPPRRVPPVGGTWSVTMTATSTPNNNAATRSAGAKMPLAARHSV
jgi:hypothetical protein